MINSRLIGMRLIEKEGVGGGHEQLAGGAFCRRGQQVDADVGPVDIARVVLHVPENIGGFHYAGGGNIDIPVRGDGDVHEGGIGQLSQRIPGIADGGFVLIIERRGETGMVHVQYLAKVADFFEAADAVIVDVQVEVYEIEGLEDIADATATVEIESAVEDDIFGLEWIGRRDNA